MRSAKANADSPQYFHPSIDVLVRTIVDQNAPVRKRRAAGMALREEAKRALALLYHPMFFEVEPILRQLKQRARSNDALLADQEVGSRKCCNAKVLALRDVAAER